jgi:hypothetical protein
MSILAATCIAVLLTSATVAVHYEALRRVSGLIPVLAIAPRPRILVVLAAALIAHVVEVSLYAFTYYLMQDHFGLGALSGDLEGGVLDFFYFSIAMYTTLGVGDLVVSGPMRIVAGIESLNGLVLITWSASFTYISMEKFWVDHRGHRTHHR